MTMPQPQTQPTNPHLKAALEFAAAGCSVVPTRADGSKAPIGSWKRYQSERANALQIASWYSDQKMTGVGIVTGKVSGNLEMLELEGKAVAAGLLERAKEIAFETGMGSLWELITNGYSELTPSGGIHWLYRIADEDVPANTKLARRPGENGAIDLLAETRGAGGYTIVAPSSDGTHPSGLPWVQLRGGPATIPMLSWDERQALHVIFRSLDAMPTAETIDAAAAAPKQGEGLTPGDDFNARAKWADILPPGWKQVGVHAGVTYWRRPGKEIGVSATSGRNDGDNFYVFTTSTQFEAEKPYSKFAAKALLEFGGDYSACAKQLRKDGYGGIQLAPAIAAPSPIGDDSDIGEQRINESTGEITERSSWWPRPLSLDDSDDEPLPAFLPRDDGFNLLYAGKVNGLLGESESGKTWIALYAVQQALTQGKRVIYIDFEDSARGIRNRLRNLGTIDEHLANLTYANPDEALHMEASTDLYSALAARQPHLVVIDGVNAAMTLLGLDLNSNTDATKFSQLILKPLKKGGAAVLTIDHVPKSKDNRGNYAIGAQSKRADIDGAAISVEVLAPFGRGQNGELKLTVTKDRPGHVRGMALNSKVAGVAHLRSQGDGDVRITISAAGTSDPFRPTHLMEQISQLLEAATEPLSKKSIETAIKGKTDAIRKATQVLIIEKHIAVEHGPRNSMNLKIVTPYRENTDPKNGENKWLEGEQNDDE